MADSGPTVRLNKIDRVQTLRNYAGVPFLDERAVSVVLPPFTTGAVIVQVVLNRLSLMQFGQRPS